MPHHQSKANRSDSKQRRSARPGGGTAHPRASAGKGSGTEGQGPSATATPLLSPAAQPAPGASSNRSDGINGQARGHVPRTYEVLESPGAQQNMPSQQQVPQVSSVQSGSRSSNGTVAKSSRPGTPSSSSVSTEVKPVIATPESAWNAVHPQLSFQFGSIGPSVGTYVQIPARTSSAPPNLDEQKQVLQSMTGPPLMGPPPLPAPMPATQMTQMSHLPGGLAPGMPVAPYWVVPVANPVIPTRMSSAVKIVHPDTHEELKFDYKNSKTDTFYDALVPVTAAVPQSRILGNGPSLTRPPSGYASGSHHSVSQNVHITQQNGHYYQPPPSGIATKHVPGTKVSSATSREETAGLSNAAAPSASGPSNSVPQAAVSHISGKQNVLPAISPVHEAVDIATSREVSPGLSTAVASSMSGPSNSVPQGAGSPVCEKQDLLPATSPVSGAVDAASSRAVTLGSDTAVTLSVSGPSNSLPQAAASAISEKHSEDADTTTSREVTTGLNAEVTPSVPGPSNSAPEVVISVIFEKLDLSPAISLVSEAVHTAASNEVTSLLSTGVDLSESGPSNSVPQAAVGAISEKQDLLFVISPVQEAVHTGTSREVITELSTPLNVSGPPNFVPDAAIVSETQDISPALSPDPATTETTTSMEAVAPGVSGTSNTVPQAAVDIVSEKQDLLPATSPISAAVDTTTSGDVTSGLSTEVAPSVPASSTSVPQSIVSSFSEKQDLLPAAISSVSAAPLVKQGSRKKKMKNILAKADAAGTTADLYNAYKAPEEKEADEVVPAKVGMSKGSINDLVKQEVTPSETAVANELDDWEDAVELPTPKVSTEDGDGKIGEKLDSEMKGGETYTRDFLLTFKEQNVELPLDFEVRPDTADLLLNPQAAFARLADRDMHSGRMLDRQLSGGPRRSMPNTYDDDRWARPPQGQHSPLWPDNYADMGPLGGFRPGSAQGLISRMPPSIRPGIAVPPLVPGLIPGKPLTPGSGSGLFRTNTVDSDRWQRMPTGQKGLIPSPQTPVPPVHKAEKRYEVGKASDEEELKQRQIKGILNKLTPQNFQKLFEQVKGVNIQAAITLTGVISQIFDKALTEPTFCEMYATFCKQLATDMPEFMEDGDRVTFKRVLLNKCQEEFHRGEREQAEASAEEEDGDNKMSAEEREEKRVKAKRRMLGNIRFIGELYKKQMLTERIMHECIRKLLGDYENPEEEDVEALCKLMSTIGYMIDQPGTREHMDAYLERLARLSNNQKLSSRMRFMLKDVIDLRRNGWHERRKVEGPKKIEEVHRDAVQERQATVAQAGRLSRVPSIGASSGRRLVPPPELNIRGASTSPMFVPTTQIGTVPSMRGGRSPFVQDVRIEDRLLLENRASTMPLSQRSADEGL